MQKVIRQAESLHTAVKHFVTEKLNHTDDIFIHGEFLFCGAGNTRQPLFKFTDRKEKAGRCTEKTVTTIGTGDEEAWSVYFRTLVPLLQEDGIRLSFVARDVHGANEKELIPQVPSSGNAVPSPIEPVEMEGMYDTGDGPGPTGAVFVLYWHSRKAGGRAHTEDRRK